MTTCVLPVCRKIVLSRSFGEPTSVASADRCNSASGRAFVGEVAVSVCWLVLQKIAIVRSQHRYQSVETARVGAFVLSDPNFKPSWVVVA